MVAQNLGWLQALTIDCCNTCDHGRGRRPCPFCDDSDFDVPILEHVLDSHSSQRGLHEGNYTASIVDVCTDMFFMSGFLPCTVLSISLSYILYLVLLFVVCVLDSACILSGL